MKAVTAEETAKLNELIFDIDSFSQNYDGQAYGIPTHDKDTMNAIRGRILEYAESVHASRKEEWIETIKNAAFALCWLFENTIPTDANLQSDFYNITMNALTGLNDLIPNAPSEKIDENQLPF